MTRPGIYARRRFIYAGLRGGSRKWLILGGIAWGLHLGRKVLIGGDPVPVYVEDLLPGEKLIISHRRVPEKKRR